MYMQTSCQYEVVDEVDDDIVVVMTIPIIDDEVVELDDIQSVVTMK